MLTLLIADDHPLFREALRTTILRIWPDACIHEAQDLNALNTMVQEHPEADLLLLDLSMPDSDGFDPLVRLRGRHPQLPVVIVSAHEDVALMRRAMDHGAMGYIPKSVESQLLAEALGSVLDGEPWFPASVQDSHATSSEEQRIALKLSELTAQQFKVFQLVTAGRLNKQIAHELGVSEATIKAHISAILRKLGASNRTEAVAMAHRLGLR